ncbi:MAG: DUF1552 domain-containing protein [Planctomycetes bacterium]|nr:DUF1552 domain-containing protein [Planctomycetota bacterium]
MKQKYLIPRRSFLRGAGVCLALPALEIMSPAVSRAADTTTKIPLRLGIFHKGNGIDPAGWEATGSETDFTLSKNLSPLEPFKKDIVVLSNVSNQPKGDHYGAMPLFMTGVQNRKPGQTFDQVIADHIGTSTQFKSFQLSAEPVDVRSTTLNSLAYDKEGRAKFVERNAQFAFDRLFRGLGDPGVRAEIGSILDAVREPTAALVKRASRNDKAVIANYLDSVRDVELAIKRQEQDASPRPHLEKVRGDVVKLDDFPSKMKTMVDLVALAFWTDATRVASCIMALESSRRIHDFLSLKADFHWSSHFERNRTLANEFNTANTWYVSQFGAAVEKMKTLKEFDGSSVFDHSVLMFGSGLSHGGQHTGSNLPLLLAGGAASGLNTGRLLKYPKQPPHANCLLTLIQHFGIEREEYSNSTGTLDQVRKA